MAHHEIKYFLLEDRDIDDLVHFYNSIHRSTRDKARFNWEFKNAPAGKAIYVIAKDVRADKIVGSQCAIPFLMKKSDGTILLTAKSEDTLVDPKYRGMNIFENMYKMMISECIKANILYIWGFTSARKPFAKLGFDLPFNHLQSLLVLKPFGAYKYLSILKKDNRLLDNIKIAFLVILSFLYYWIKKIIFYGTKNQDDYVCYEDNYFERIDNYELQELEFKDKNITILKTKEFLRWRISENPYSKNHFTVFFKKQDKIVCTISFSNNKDNVWYILNEMYHRELIEIEKSLLLGNAIKELKNKYEGKIDLIRNWEFDHNLFGQNLIAVKRNLGFTVIKRGIPFVWLNLDKSNSIDVKQIVLSRIATQGMT